VTPSKHRHGCQPGYEDEDHLHAACLHASHYAYTWADGRRSADHPPETEEKGVHYRPPTRLASSQYQMSHPNLFWGK
jgi:hypothetical protein